MEREEVTGAPGETPDSKTTAETKKKIAFKGGLKDLLDDYTNTMSLILIPNLGPNFPITDPIDKTRWIFTVSDMDKPNKRKLRFITGGVENKEEFTIEDDRIFYTKVVGGITILATGKNLTYKNALIMANKRLGRLLSPIRQEQAEMGISPTALPDRESDLTLQHEIFDFVLERLGGIPRTLVNHSTESSIHNINTQNFGDTQRIITTDTSSERVSINMKLISPSSGTINAQISYFTEEGINIWSDLDPTISYTLPREVLPFAIGRNALLKARADFPNSLYPNITPSPETPGNYA